MFDFKGTDFQFLINFDLVMWNNKLENHSSTMELRSEGAEQISHRDEKSSCISIVWLSRTWIPNSSLILT